MKDSSRQIVRKENENPVRDLQMEEKYIRPVILFPWKKKFNTISCSECATSCQSACKTSCTVGNQYCEMDDNEDE